ncbi:sel1 repeat family protein [Gilliamella sp. wkB112]|uniref:sel1 repeat family protein n=1 Tax=Gilliamella sp. wkB112 TaxID=3120257 RepID=UPI00080DE852|nr:sel1 repeat family protein [Gilliamella apicola]OCG01494.1 hypothetical protein A9G12_02820 [Gilliamella apicola]
MKSYISFLLCLITSITVNSYAQPLATKVQEKKLLATNNSYWTIDYALQLAKELGNLSYGITDIEKFNQIIVQKNKGDPNALYIYAYVLRYYNNANENIGLTVEQGRIESNNIFWELAENKHPQACNEILNTNEQELMTQRHITRQQLLDKQLLCIEIALKNHLQDYDIYADILTFELKHDEADQLLLVDSLNINKPQLIEKAVNLYKLCAAKKGDDICMARVTEAYYEGIGVKKDKIKAAAWAKLTTERSNINSNFKTIRNAYLVYAQLNQDKSIQNSEEFQKLYTELQKIPKL